MEFGKAAIRLTRVVVPHARAASRRARIGLSPITIFVALLLAVFSPRVSAEFCWMTGCTNAVGYIPTQTSVSVARIDMFADGKLPAVGMTATLAEYVYLRLDPIDEPQGHFVLSPGTVVKVLEYVTTTQKFAIIRVVRSENTRREECMSTLQCRAKFY